MTDPLLTFVESTEAGHTIVVNFGLQAGREATQAEVDRLVDRLLQEVDSVEVVSEERVEADRAMRGRVYQVRVELPAREQPDRLAELVEAWARDCIAERSVLTP